MRLQRVRHARQTPIELRWLERETDAHMAGRTEELARCDEYAVSLRHGSGKCMSVGDADEPRKIDAAVSRKLALDQSLSTPVMVEPFENRARSGNPCATEFLVRFWLLEDECGHRVSELRYTE